MCACIVASWSILRWFVGYGVSIGLGYLVNLLILGVCLWPQIPTDKRPKHREASKWVGILERILYTTSIVLYKPEWVAVWLGFKVAVSWNSRPANGEEYGIAISNIYIIGNVLSLSFGILGAMIIRSTFYVF